MPLRDGERQVTTRLDEIRNDHVERYRWAAAQLAPTDIVLDCGCGIGYGATVLAERAQWVFGCDGDAETIEFAEKNWKRGNIVYGVQDLQRTDAMLYSARVATAFEIIEHIADPKPFLRNLKAGGVKTLFASVPNEAVYTFRTPQGTIKFHERHYTREELENLLNDCGWRVDEWWGQKGPESPVERDVEGRTLVVKCSPVANVETLVPRRVADEPKRLKHVSIVAMGGSAESYIANIKQLGDRHVYCDEVWAINAMGGVIQCDLVFHMDDVRVQEIRAAARPDTNIAHMLCWLKKTTTPVMTSVPHADYPATIAYPFEDVVNDLGSVYFNNTVAYAVAYAIHRKVEKISLFGCDFGYTNVNKAERGRACVEYWLGVADARGIKLGLPQNTVICDTLVDDSPEDVYAYGYDGVRIVYRKEDGRHRFAFVPRETLPTAEEVERMYDHGLPPNSQVSSRFAAE
jgi:protein-L-isoaspartate O-methyltransferase